MATIKFDDLENAFEWSSAGGDFSDSEAIISKHTGEIYYLSEGEPVEGELPADIDDESLYVSVPNKHDLDLGRSLALKFASNLSPDMYSSVERFFSKSGAYSRFKDLLEREGKLDAWYSYERDAIKNALIEWADSEGLTVTFHDENIIGE